MSVIRDFIPGECTLSPAAEAFTALDQAPATDPRLEEVAKQVCQSCVQRPFCEEQRTEIASVLGARGVVGTTVVGGIAVEAPEPSEPEAAALYEPKCKFDLSVVPMDPRHKLEIARQAFRSGQVSTKAGELNNHPQLSSRLYERLANSGSLGLEEVEAQNIARLVARSVLKCRIAQRHLLPRRKRSSELTEAEINDAERLQDVFVDDVLALKAMGALRAVVIAQFHKPEFFAGVMRLYEKSFDITPGYVQDAFRGYAVDPLSKIRAIILKKRQLKDTASTIGLNNTVLAAIDEDGPNTARVEQIARRGKINRYLSATQRSSIPELRPYITAIANSGAADPWGEFKTLLKRVQRLQEKHTDGEVVVLAYIAYHSEDSEEATQVFLQNFEELQRKYEDHPDLTRKKIQRFVLEHMSDADAAVRRYLEKLAKIRAICTETGMTPNDGFARQLAMYYKQELNSESVTIQYKKYRLKHNPQRNKKLEGWMRDKLTQLYENDRYEEVAANLSTFVQRNYLRVAYATEDQEPTPYDRIDPKKGAYLAWSQDFLYFKPEEREAILSVFGLDRIVLGRAVDVAELQKYFQTDDLTKYVDLRLLPNTFSQSRNFRNPEAVLGHIRRWVRDNPNKAIMGISAKEQAKVNAAFDKLMASLESESLEGHNLQDKELHKSMRLMVRRVMACNPRVSGERDMHKIALKYLDEAATIKGLGIRRPYAVALGYSSAFCKLFTQVSKKESPQVSRNRLNAIISRTTVGQAVPLLRRYQQLINDMSPEFDKRRIPSAYCRTVCFGTVYDKEKVMNVLKAYDIVRKKYASNPEVTTGTIHYFCFAARSADPVKAIEDWRTAVNDLDDYYKQHINMHYIKQKALSKRGTELTSTLDKDIAQVAAYFEQYKHAPHDALDEEVVKYAVFTRPNASKWLADYIVRWEQVRAADATTAEPRIIRKLLTIHEKDPLDAIRRYKELREEFEGDLYIQSWMIDEALKWSLSQAFVSLKRMRSLLRRTTVRLDDTRQLAGGGQRELHEMIADNASSTEDVVLGSDEQESQRNQIATLLRKATTVERAAIAEAYNLPWLAYNTDDIAKAYAFYNAQTIDELRPAVNQLLIEMARKAA